MARRRAGRIEHLHQPLERQVLMGVGRQVGRAHPADQFAEARVARGVGAQHQRVDEEADQIVERASVRPAIGLPIGMSVPAPSRVSSAASAACSTMNRLAWASRASARKPGVQSRPQCAAALAAAIARTPGGPVGRQLDLLGQPVERLGPERELPRDHAAGSSRRRAARAATACSRHTAPAAAPARRIAAAARA